jgi:hypothetical protein
MIIKTYRLGDKLFIRIPTEKSYASKTFIEQKLLQNLKQHITLKILNPIAIGKPSDLFPFHFSIYDWIEESSANHIQDNQIFLKNLANDLADFLK